MNFNWGKENEAEVKEDTTYLSPLQQENHFLDHGSVVHILPAKEGEILVKETRERDIYIYIYVYIHRDR